MLHSMTAFARCSAETLDFRLAVEMRSVNHRFLELNIRMPESLRHLENLLRQQIQASIKRGKIDLNLYLENHTRLNEQTLNIEALTRWTEKLNHIPEIGDKLGQLTWSDVLRLPQVWENVKETIDWDQEVQTLFQQTLQDFVAMRQREGEKIAQVLLERLDFIEQQTQKLKAHLPQLEQHLRQSILQRCAELTQTIDVGRIEQEIVFYLARNDVQEELDRLQFHSQEIRNTLQHATQTGEAVGRRLDFTLQELNREANTLGSKAADVVLSQASIELKLCIEQMREQVQNLM